MCGIVGFSGKYPVDETKMRWLLVLNEARGKDSTGLFTVKADKEKSQEVYKDAVKASDFVLREDTHLTLRGAMSVIGHTRGASWGDITQENAHPFTIDGVTGVHNGFVIQELMKKYGFKEDFKVDSQVIFAYLAKHNGDFKCLKDIEGAITIAYMIPDKYPGVVNIYRREARELHFGRAKEGIYFSSEKLPLEMIGCTHILPIPDLTFMAFKDGEILDAVDCEPPIIKTMPLGIGRYHWKVHGNKSEWSQYKEFDEPPVKIYQSNNYPHQRSVNKQAEMFDTYDNVLGGLVKKVTEEIQYITSKDMPHVLDIYSYDTGDINCCLVVLELVNSAHKNDGLPGFLVHDKMDSRICGITSIGGLTILKYKLSDCGIPRTIVMADPVDGKMRWEWTFTPDRERVLEVTLQLPFPQGEQTSPIDDTDIERKRMSEKLVEIGGAKLSLLPAIVKRHGNILALRGEDSCEIPKPKGEVHTRSEIGKILRDSARENTGNSDGDIQGALEIPRRNGKTVCDVNISKEEIQEILRKENDSFKFNPQIKKFRNTVEFSLFMSILSKFMSKYFQIARLTTDAATIKYAKAEKDGTCYSIGAYTCLLIEKFCESYMICKKTPENSAIIKEFITLYREGKIRNSKEEPIPKIVGTGKLFEPASFHEMMGTEYDVDAEYSKKKENQGALNTGAQIIGSGRTREIQEGGRVPLPEYTLHSFIIPQSFYKNILEFIAYRFTYLEELPMYSTEKKEAIKKAVINHNFQLKKVIMDFKDARSVLQDRAVMTDMPILEKVHEGLKMLGNLQMYNEEFLEELKK